MLSISSFTVHCKISPCIIRSTTNEQWISATEPSQTGYQVLAGVGYGQKLMRGLATNMDMKYCEGVPFQP